MTPNAIKHITSQVKAKLNSPLEGWHAKRDGVEMPQSLVLHESAEIAPYAIIGKNCATLLLFRFIKVVQG